MREPFYSMMMKASHNFKDTWSNADEKVLEEFAEMVVEECVEMILSELKNTTMTISQPPESSVIWYACNKIYIHFGVK